MKALITILTIFFFVNTKAQDDTLFLNYEKAEDAVKIDSILENARNGTFQLLDSNFIETDWDVLYYIYSRLDTVYISCESLDVKQKVLCWNFLSIIGLVDKLVYVKHNSKELIGVAYEIYRNDGEYLDSRPFFYIKQE